MKKGKSRLNRKETGRQKQNTIKKGSRDQDKQKRGLEREKDFFISQGIV
jgi:hypothetical protein